MLRARRTAIVALLVLVAGLLSAGVAAAVSGGGYDPAQQDCSPMADNHDVQGAEPGCHNFKLNVEDHNGGRYAQFGIAQEAQNENPHAGDYKVNTNSDGSGLGVSGSFNSNWEPLTPDSCGVFDLATLPFDEILYLTGMSSHPPCTITPSGQVPDPGLSTPTVSTGLPDGSAAALATGTEIYLGADDNLDSGEHDGVNGGYGTHRSANGPSDGGAVIVDWHPGQVAAWLATLTAAPGAPGPFLSNPVPLVSAGFGMCADGICLGIYSAKTTMYQGCSDANFGPGQCKDAPKERDVYNYDGKKWDPENCSSGSDKDEQQCAGPNKGDPKDMDGYRQAEAGHVVAQPGFQFYEDPDPQGSPIGPYPLPALYAGTCGVAAGGGAAPAAPASPVTNSAGQVIVSTGC
jgi:hypothetical protein